MSINRDFELGEYPPPAYVVQTPEACFGGSEPRAQGASPPSDAKGQAGTPPVLRPQIPAVRPLFHRANASENIHIPSIHPDPSPKNSTPWYSCIWEKHWRIILIWLLNIPFILVFTMDVYAVIFPASAIYRNIILTNYCFVTIFCISVFTGLLINLPLLLDGMHNTSFSYEVPERQETRWVSFFLVFRVILLCFGVAVWPFISYIIHEHVEPIYPSCSERGFASSLMVSVVPGTSDAMWGKSWLMNNVTIESGEDVFGLNLSPSIPEARDMDKFYLTPSEELTSPGLLPKVRGTMVAMSLNKKIYRFQYTTPASDNHFYESASNGSFSDKRNFYLSFLSLSVRSVKTVNWSHVGERPSAVMVDDKRVVLQSVEKHPGDNKDAVFRMCAPWSIQEMVNDRDAMEKVLVPLTRLGVEIAIWGGEH